jgi:Flp pilus assembly secretin CpaC
MLPRLRSAHVAVVALACAVALNHARGDDACPCAKKKLVQRVYSVADLVVPVKDYDANCLVTSPKATACEGGCCCPAPSCDAEVMCQQPEQTPCCQGGACCPNGACCPDGACCPKAGCCQKSDAAACTGGGCCSNAATNWTAVAAPECYKRSSKTCTADDNAVKLIRLIQSSVFATCCPDGDCQCTAEYCPMGMSLVVCAPQCIQEQVAALLERLHRESNTEVAFEFRMVRVADGPAKQAFEAAVDGCLDGPMFLCPKKLAAVMNAIQGDKRSQIEFSPKATVFNGQSAKIACSQDVYFVTKLNWAQCAGQPVPVPVNAPIHLGFEYGVRPTVSADHRFVRCELNAEFRELSSSPVPLFPMTTFISPVFEGGSQGQPIPFTQFIQQPEVTTRSLSKCLTIPDGQTAVFFAGRQTKTDQTQPEEPGVPLLDWINDIVDLVHPPAPTPTYEEHLFVLVTPRIIEWDATENESAARPMPAGPMVPQQAVVVGGLQRPADLDDDVHMLIRRCGATAPAKCAAAPAVVAPSCSPAPVEAAPCCPTSQPCPVAPCQACPIAPCPPPAIAALTSPTCGVAPCALPPMAVAFLSAQPKLQIQLDACVMTIDPSTWEQPVTAAWSDLSPKTCDGKPKTISAEVAKRFCDSMRAQGAAKVLAQPTLITLNGQMATFQSGGQQVIPEVSPSGEIVRTRFEPLGTQITFLPTVVEGGQVRLDLEACLSHLDSSCGFRIGGATYHGRSENRFRSSLALPDGQTVLMYGGRDSDGRDVMVTVTPHLINAPQPMAYCPPPIAYPQSSPPGPITPTVWAAPMAIGQDILLTSGQSPASSEQSKLDRLLTRYKLACDDGDEAEARRLAKKCLAIDPTCFGK